MQALVKREAGPGLWLEDVPEPTVAARDVLIKVDRTGICGTDLHIYKWDDWARKTVPVPLVNGKASGAGRLRRRTSAGSMPISAANRSTALSMAAVASEIGRAHV